jgi:hypothetical protein
VTKPEPAASAALRVQAAALRAQADALDALASTLVSERDELLGVAQCRALGVGRDALLAAAARGEIAITRGPRQRLQVTRHELDRWLASKPYVVAAKSEPVASLAEWERSVRRKVAS